MDTRRVKRMVALAIGLGFGIVLTLFLQAACTRTLGAERFGFPSRETIPGEVITGSAPDGELTQSVCVWECANGLVEACYDSNVDCARRAADQCHLRGGVNWTRFAQKDSENPCTWECNDGMVAVCRKARPGDVVAPRPKPPDPQAVTIPWLEESRATVRAIRADTFRLIVGNPTAARIEPDPLELWVNAGPRQARAVLLDERGMEIPVPEGAHWVWADNSLGGAFGLTPEGPPQWSVTWVEPLSPGLTELEVCLLGWTDLICTSRWVTVQECLCVCPAVTDGPDVIGAH